MKTNVIIKIFLPIIILLILVIFNQCSNKSVQMNDDNSYKILFLHHSTGMVVWKGETGNFEKVKRLFGTEYVVPEWFNNYNIENGTSYFIEEQSFPSGDPYPWNNYPYDYYNIWVINAGNEPFKEESTLEILTNQYDMIILKHCFPVSRINPNNALPDVASPDKKIENYKLQYAALKNKMHEFPNTKFLIWTGAANVEAKSTPEQAALARDFFSWVKNEWDSIDDNIYLWDFYELETEGGLYLKEKYARNSNDSHPNTQFAVDVAPLFCQRIVDIIETNGANTSLTGQKIN